MARQQRTRKSTQKKNERALFDDLAPQTKQAIVAVLLLVVAVFLTLAMFDYAGIAGSYTREGLTFLFGAGAFLAPLACLVLVYVFLKPREDERISVSKAVGVALLFLSLLGLMELYRAELGGIGGTALGAPLAILFGTVASSIMLTATFVIGIFLLLNTGLALPRFLRREKKDEEEEVDVAVKDTQADDEAEGDAAAPAAEPAVAEDAPREKPAGGVASKLGFKKEADLAVSSFEGTYAAPPLSLLSKDKGRARGSDPKASANIIKRTLKNFNIEVEMDDVAIGPAVTRFALKPAEGVRISKIVGLQNNLELALAASPVRIEAPIPGKSLVGIEVPNSTKATVGLASLLASPEYTDSPKPLLVALGRDITGVPQFANIGKMPHALIAGTTGSGKSATMNAIITSLLFRNSPEQLRFIMVDPKRVELTLYNGIPHLLAPVITEPKKAIMALKWAIKEMERRYDVLQAEQVRDIDSYHEKVYKPAKAAWQKKGSPEDAKDSLPEPMPYIVVTIDELSDLMQSYPRELEACIVRLAQMSRAVGIHLIISTQRPSVNVITGLIKANIPSRIALQVASQIDSRTILDQVGAERLIGQGDMLFLSGELAKPRRLQSAFVSEEEVKKVVDYLKSQSELQELDTLSFEQEGQEQGDGAFFGAIDDDDEEDDLFGEAKRAVIEANKASTSYLQRKLRIGYSRAARLIDLLEERGVIGPQDGAKPRQILAQREEEHTARGDDDEDSSSQSNA